MTRQDALDRIDEIADQWEWLWNKMAQIPALSELDEFQYKMNRAHEQIIEAQGVFSEPED